MFLHHEGENPKKFISDTLIECYVSYIYHWNKYMAISDLELVLSTLNNNRNKCKIGTWWDTERCQSDGSIYKWAKPCYSLERINGPP